MKRAWQTIAIGALLGVLLGAVACNFIGEQGPPKPAIGSSVDILGIWGGDELTNFEAMVEPWQTDTLAKVNFTGTRDITPTLTTRVEGNNPPDIAITAEVGLFRQFAAEGRLIPLSKCGVGEMVTAEYPQGFVDLGTVDGELYGFFMKADTKGTIWYNPKLFAEKGLTPLTADSSFADLIALSDKAKAAGVAPWSVGIESGGASGWPGTDWIQQILLNEAGGAVYDGVIDGTIPFTDPRVKDAWQKFGKIVLTEGYTSQGGAEGVNATGFQDATFPPFMSPPQAAMTYLGGFAGGFITEQFPNAKPVEDYNFFTFPGGGITGGASLVYAFDESPETCSLLNYLASAEAQKIWVDEGGFTSVNKMVATTAYPDPVAKAQAEQLTQAKVFRFDLDDAIGGALQTAYFEGVTQYLASPGDLDKILASIEAARE